MIGAAGEGVNKAGSGMQRLADGMSKFSAVDPDKIKAIAALPLDKLAAMGAIMNQGNQVAAASGSNQGAAMAAQGGGSSNTVVAPTTNTTVNKQATVVALPVRNQDQTMSRYVRSRYQA